MANMPYKFGLPRTLTGISHLMHCQLCNVVHLVKALHTSKVNRPPPGHTIISYIAGPLSRNAASLCFFLTFTELHALMKFYYLLHNKAEAKQYVLEVLEKFNRHFAKGVARIIVDNANEYLTKSLIAKLGSMGVQIDPTTTYTPEESSVSERANRTIMNRVQATLHLAQMPLYKYWTLCVLDTVIKTNSTLHDTIKDVTRRLWNMHRNPHSPY